MKADSDNVSTLFDSNVTKWNLKNLKLCSTLDKQPQEHAFNIPQNVKDQITADITSQNETMTTEVEEQIREALERLKNSSMEIGKAIYSNTSSDSTVEPAQEAHKSNKTWNAQSWKNSIYKTTSLEAWLVLMEFYHLEYWTWETIKLRK